MTSKEEKQKVLVGLAMAQVVHLMEDLRQFTDQGNGFNTHYEIYAHLREYYARFTLEMQVAGFDIPKINRKIRQKGRDIEKEQTKAEIDEIVDLIFKHLVGRDK